MIFTNTLSILLLENDHNGVYNRNLHSIQELMRLDKSTSAKFKHVYAYFPNLAILTNSNIPGEIQVNFGHTYVDNKPLGETVTAFPLAGYLESMMVVSINYGCTFNRSRKKIRLLVMEVLLCTAVRNLE